MRVIMKGAATGAHSLFMFPVSSGSVGVGWARGYLACLIPGPICEFPKRNIWFSKLKHRDSCNSSNQHKGLTPTGSQFPLIPAV